MNDEPKKPSNRLTGALARFAAINSKPPSPVWCTFTVNEDQHAKIDAWREKVEAKALADGRIRTCNEALGYGGDYPYYGAIGGELTYVFTGTSIGDILKVQMLGEELDVTDYDSW